MLRSDTTEELVQKVKISLVHANHISN